jgi:hypothetical protein
MEKGLLGLVQGILFSYGWDYLGSIVSSMIAATKK